MGPLNSSTNLPTGGGAHPIASSAISSPTSSGTNVGASTQADPGLGGLASEQAFLQLLVAQLQNQDPTAPQDGTQFVAQLAQFSSLEQLIAIRGDMDSVTQGAVGTTSTSSTQGGN